MLNNRYQSAIVNAAVKRLLGSRDLTHVLVIPDWHIPSEDTKATDLVINYAEWRKKSSIPFDGWIQLGDLLDFNVLSSHNKNDLLSVEGKRLEKDFAATNGILDRLQAAIPGPGFVIQGNHEMRLNRYLSANPQLVGLGLTVPEKLGFDERDITWVENWEKGIVLPIGNATFVHGSTTSVGHAAAMLRKFSSCVYYGHTHDIAMASQITAGDAKVRVAQSLGCLQNEFTYWNPSHGNKWQLAFADFTFMKSGYFSYTVHQIHDYKTVIGGRLFGPKGLIK